MEREQPHLYLLVSPSENGKHRPSLAPASETPASEPEDDIDLRWFWGVLKRRAPVILGVAIAMTAAVGWWTFNQEKEYRSKFQLLVEPVTDRDRVERLTQAPTAGDAIRQNSGLDYETQIEVLLSPQVLQPFIEDIAQTYPEISYDSFVGKDKLSIERLKNTKILEVYYQDTDPEKIQFVLFELAKIYLRYSFQERQTDLSQGIRFVEGQLPELRGRVDLLQGELQAFRQQHNLLDPEEQAKQLSQQVQTLEQQRLETQVELNNTRTLYDRLQAQLGLPPTQAIAASYLSEAPRYQDLLNQLQQVELELAIESTRFLEGTPTIETLKDKRQNLLPLLREEARQVLGGNSLEASESQTSPSVLRSQLTEQFVEAANRREVLAVQQSALARAASRLNQQVQQMPFLARKYTDLQRELNVATESLNRFLAARETLQIEAAQKTLPWQLLSKPKVPENPILPKPRQNLILGALAGLFLGVGAALLSEKFDNALRSPEEIKENARVPLLGVIPFSKEIKSVDRAQVGLQSHADISDRATPRETPQFHWYVASPFLESFRSLQANIRLLGSDTPTNSIIISSPEPADGKSTVAVHLAQAAAAMGRRVLLVDADLRRPQVHQFLDLPNFQGLSDAIATDLTPEQAIQEVPAWPNLHVLTAGSLPPDPTRLLASERMQQFVGRFQSRFDLVIYDLPPSLGFADSRLLAPLTNGVIFVVRIGKTDRTKLKHTLDEFKTSKLTVLGIVANGTRGRGHSSYNYYQNYASPTSSRLSLTRFLRRR